MIFVKVEVCCDDEDAHRSRPEAPIPTFWARVPLENLDVDQLLWDALAQEVPNGWRLSYRERFIECPACVERMARGGP